MTIVPFLFFVGKKYVCW